MRNELLINGMIFLTFGLLLLFVSHNESQIFESTFGQLAILASSELKMKYEFYKIIELIGITTFVMGFFSLFASFIPGDSPIEFTQKNNSQDHIYKKLKNIYYQMGINISHEDEPNYFQAKQTSPWKNPFISDNTITKLDNIEYKIKIDIEIPISNQIITTITLIFIIFSCIALYPFTLTTIETYHIAIFCFKLSLYTCLGLFVLLTITNIYYNLTKYNQIHKIINRL